MVGLEVFDASYDEILSVQHNPYHEKIKKRIWFTYDKTKNLIAPGNVVAEIGVGPISFLSRVMHKATVVGIDLNASQSFLCHKYGIELRICDVISRPLPLEDESIDVIFLLETIEHLCMYPGELFDSIYKKLKKGGHLIVSSVNFLRFSNRIRVISGKNPLINHFEYSDDGRNHIREYLLEEMIYYLQKSHFQIRQKYTFGISDNSFLVKNLMKIVYLYPNFRNYFMVIANKV